MNLESVVWPELPDCVLERTFSECTDPCKDYLNSSSPSKERANPTEQSNQVSAERAHRMRLSRRTMCCQKINAD